MTGQVKRISEADKENLKKTITIEEVSKTLKNTRQPLTLLDTLYKLLSSTLASKATLVRILENEQKAYVPGRFISGCTRNTYDIFTHAKENNLPGIILLIDFEKAFNSESFEFILTTLEIFDFGENFKTWI